MTAERSPTARPDLAEVLERQRRARDEGRAAAVSERHTAGRRTARENLDDVCDPGSFVEYGSLALAAQSSRRDLDELIARTAADGLVAGVGRVNGGSFAADAATCCPTTTRCWPARRATSPNARRTACSRSSSGCACRSSCSAKAAADGPEIPTCRPSPRSTPARSRSSPA